MSDNIIDNLADDVALATALRNFLTTPAVIDLVRAVVTEEVNAELARTNVLTPARLLEILDVETLDGQFATEAKARSAIRGHITASIEHEIETRLAYYIHEDDFETKFDELIDIDSKIEAKVSDAISEEMDEIVRDLRIIRRD
jgi:hypothetical protein